MVLTVISPPLLHLLLMVDWKAIQIREPHVPSANLYMEITVGRDVPPLQIDTTIILPIPVKENQTPGP
jgi:hypothetical protein